MTEDELKRIADRLEEAQKHYEHDIEKYGHNYHKEGSMTTNWKPVECRDDYASKGIAGSGLGLGIAGTVLGLMNNNGGIGGILGGNTQNHVSQREFELAQQLAAKDAKIGLLEGTVFTDQKISDTYRELNNKIESVYDRLNAKIDCNKAAQDAVNTQQVAFNAAQNATIACLKGQVEQLYALTKLVVPNASVCPGWGNVTVTPEAPAAA